jgi:hypothetical protein
MTPRDRRASRLTDSSTNATPRQALFACCCLALVLLVDDRLRPISEKICDSWRLIVQLSRAPVLSNDLKKRLGALNRYWPMRKLKVFYSWQSDRQRRLRRDFIETALLEAVALINADAALGVQVEIDSDTKGVPGTPPITETILRKIAECDVFVPDLTFVAETPEDRKIPNPNVMVEYGYALRTKGYGGMMPVMNTAFGLPDSLPFDMRHLRHPIRYEAKASIKDAERRAVRQRLAQEFDHALRSIARGMTAHSATKDNNAVNRAQELFQVHLSSSMALGNPTIVPAPKFVLQLVPAAAFEPTFALSPQTVRKIRPYFVPPDFLGSDPKTGSDVDEWWSADAPRHIRPNIPNPESEWCTRLFADGLFQLTQNVGQEEEDDNEILMDGRLLEANLVGAADQFGEAYCELGLRGPGWISITLVEVQDIRVTGGLGKASRRIRRPSVPLGTVSLDDLSPPLGNEMKSLFDRLWMAAGFEEGSPSFPNPGQWYGYTRAPYRPPRLAL